MTMDDAVTPIGGVDAAAGALVIDVLRTLVGLAMIAAPRLVVRPEDGAPAPGNLVFMVRTIGVRDLALGLGAVTAARSSLGGNVRRWIQFGLLSDALDVMTGAGSSRLLGLGGAATAALVPVPFVAADLWVLRRAR
jgi:hypothetical protein